MKTSIIDTNVFLRLILNDVPKQADEAEKLLKSAKAGRIKLLVPQIIIFEVEFALSKYYKFAKGEIIDQLTAIVSMEYLTVEDGVIFKQAIKFYENGNLSLVDCFLVVKAEFSDASIFSFDKALNKN